MFSRVRLYAAVLFSSFLCIMVFVFADADEQTGITAAIGSDGIQRVEVLGGEYFFNPKSIGVKVNVPVEILIRKEPGIIPHNFVISSPEVGIEINEPIYTEPQKITFTPTKTGKVIFYCNKKFLFFKSHRKKGMEGTIEVLR
jgi:plastocyanin domain-containing protein